MTRNSSDHFLNSSSLRGPATNKPGKKVKNTKQSTSKAKYILRRICLFANSWSLMVTNFLKNTLELQNLECTDSCSWTSFCLETDDCNVPNALSSYLDPRWSLCTQKINDERKRWTGIQKIIEIAVLKTSFRFPEINLGFVTSARGAGLLTPKIFQGRGAFDQRKGPHGGEFDQKKFKCQMPGGQPEGGGGVHGHPWIWLIHYTGTEVEHMTCDYENQNDRETKDRTHAVMHKEKNKCSKRDRTNTWQLNRRNTTTPLYVSFKMDRGIFVAGSKVT